MGIFHTILFASAALAAIMTIVSTVRVYVRDVAALRAQLVTANTKRLIVWRIMELQQRGFDLGGAGDIRGGAHPDGSQARGHWSVPLPSLAA